MWITRIFWTSLIRYIARRHGFLDPISLLAQIRKFTPVSEVAEPIELLRAGAVFHARGLINRTAIQHNLDWIWPYWVEQQFNPASDSFLPRAFSITHVNLTQRNWTALGIYKDVLIRTRPTRTLEDGTWEALLRGGETRMGDLV